MNTTALANSGYWSIRIRRHLILTALAVGVAWIVFTSTPPPDIRHRLSMATAYTSLLFLIGCLLLGPCNILRRRPNPVSFDLRRDIGIWAGILALLHTAIGLTVHLRGRMWMYFFKQLHPPTIQNTQFGLANYLGFAAALLFVMLLAISNDLSLRSLKVRRWKSLQRWTYGAALLTVLHGFFYQLAEKRHMSWVAVYWTLILIAIAMQIVGVFTTRRKRSALS